MYLKYGTSKLIDLGALGTEIATKEYPIAMLTNSINLVSHVVPLIMLLQGDIMPHCTEEIKV